MQTDLIPMSIHSTHSDKIKGCNEMPLSLNAPPVARLESKSTIEPNDRSKTMV